MFIYWEKLIHRVKIMQHQRLLLFLSLICGLTGGLAAVLLKNLVHFTHHFLTTHLRTEDINLLYIAFPLVGLILTVIFVRNFVKEDISHGISKILFAISRRKSKLRRHNTYSSFIGSTFTVGFGGSVGLEAPIVLTGASIGSNLGKAMRLNYKDTTLLIGCGVAGALAGIFKAPIAAVVFGLEVLMLDLTMGSIIPLLISSVTGATIAYFLLGKDVMFTFIHEKEFIVSEIGWFILLGVLSGIFSVFFIKGTKIIEGQINKIKLPYSKAILGGLLLGLLIFFFPPLYGEGYDALKAILNDRAVELAHGTIFYNLRGTELMFLSYLLLIIVFKVFATSLTNGSGGVGGIFAPALFIGGILGYLSASVFNHSQLADLSTINFALVGMSGLMAGVMHAPLTGIFLIAEITGGYELFIPLIITSTIAFLTSKSFVANSLYNLKLAERGELLTHHKDKAILTLMDIEDVIEKNFTVLDPDDPLGKLVIHIKKSKRNVFPVVDKEGYLVGILTLNDVRDIIFDSDLYDSVLVKDIMYFPETSVSFDDTLEQIADKIEATGRYNVPVLKDGKYLGFISRAKVFSAYRKMIKDFSEE